MPVAFDDEEAFQEIELLADPMMLRIVYTNLVTNAIKYGRRGRAITLGGQATPDGYRFHSRNEGSGIPVDKLETVFERFVRLDDESTRKQKGTGLGLFNTRQIIERHGGRMWVESAEGEWADFIFTMPMPPEGKSA